MGHCRRSSSSGTLTCHAIHGARGARAASLEPAPSTPLAPSPKGPERRGCVRPVPLHADRMACPCELKPALASDSWQPEPSPLSPLPHRNLGLPLHLWASSQPEGVAEPRGTMDVGGGDGMLSRHQTLPLLPLWDSYPPVHSCEGFDPKCPGPDALSTGV